MAMTIAGRADGRTRVGAAVQTGGGERHEGKDGEGECAAHCRGLEWVDWSRWRMGNSRKDGAGTKNEREEVGEGHAKDSGETDSLSANMGLGL